MTACYLSNKIAPAVGRTIIVDCKKSVKLAITFCSYKDITVNILQHDAHIWI